MDSQNLPAPIHGDLETNRQLAQRADAALLRRVSRSHAEPSGEPESLLTFQFVLRALWQWWHVATPIALVLGALSAALILFFFQPVYRAGAVLQIAGHAPFIAYELREPEDKLHEFEATQIELLQSPLVLEPVVALPEIAALPEISARDNPADWLSKQVKITQVGHSELYRVYIDSIHPTSASLLVNSLLDSYFQVRANDDAVRTKRVIELLDQEKQSRALEVKKLRAKMHSLSSDLVGKDPFTGRPSAEALGRLHPLEGLRERLTTVEVERKMLEVEIQALREAIGRENVPVPGVEVEMAVDSSPEVRELRALIAAKKTLLHKVAHTAAQGKEDPSHRRLQMEIESYEGALKKTAGDARGYPRGSWRGVWPDGLLPGQAHGNGLWTRPSSSLLFSLDGWRRNQARDGLRHNRRVFLQHRGKPRACT